MANPKFQISPLCLFITLVLKDLGPISSIRFSVLMLATSLIWVTFQHTQISLEDSELYVVRVASFSRFDFYQIRFLFLWKSVCLTLFWPQPKSIYVSFFPSPIDVPCFITGTFPFQSLRDFQSNLISSNLRSGDQIRIWDPGVNGGNYIVGLMELGLLLPRFCLIAMLRLHVDLIMYWQQYLLGYAQIWWLENVLVSSLLVVVFLQSLPQCYAPAKEFQLHLGCDYIDFVMGLWLHQFGFCGVEMSRLHMGLVNYWQQDLRNALASYGWESLDTSESETWDGLVMLYESVEEIYKDDVSQNDLGTEVLVPLYLHFRISFGHIGFHATFCEKRFSHKLLHTNRNKEKSNMKLDNNGSSGRLASKATLRKASSNSLLLYFLLVYGTYICVCNNCVSIILYVFVITLLD